MRVHQATGVAGPNDAVTEQIGAYGRLLSGWGIGGGAHAVIVAPRAPGGVTGLDRLDMAADDLLLLHYSGWVPGMERLLEGPQRKLVIYHNITPARYFWRVDPRVALTCEVGRARLPRVVSAAHTVAAVSSYNAAELKRVGARDTRVVPILFEPGRLTPGSAAGDGTDSSAPLVLCVGRLAPHKRPDLAIRAFALYQRHHCSEARLMCVGPPANPAYARSLERLVGHVGARNVTLAGGVPQSELNAALAAARVFLSMSEHEGFCVPLLEALSAGVPAVARPAGGMREVGGNAVLWSQAGDLAEVAELLHLAAQDGELRAELSRRGTARVERFSHDRVAAEVRAAVDAAVA
jgi:L-malate glycosyltransferase